MTARHPIALLAMLAVLVLPSVALSQTWSESGDAGNLILLQPDATAYKELARSKVCGPTWAHPALSDGRVYVRDDKELVCLKLD